MMTSKPFDIFTFLEQSSQPFVESVLQSLETISIQVSHYELDHLCYRTSSLDEYQLIKTQLLTRGHLLTESIIGGRPIAVIKLNDPIHITCPENSATKNNTITPCHPHFQERYISIIELPSPKPGRAYSSGLEHVVSLKKRSKEEKSISIVFNILNHELPFKFKIPSFANL